MIRNKIDEIILYDISGKEVKQLVNRIHAPGNYNLKITSENLNSGIYLVQLISLNSIISKKIVLIK